MKSYRCTNCNKLLLKYKDGSEFEIVCTRCKTKQKYRELTWRETLEKAFEEDGDVMDVDYCNWQFNNMTGYIKGFTTRVVNDEFEYRYKGKLINLIK